MFAHLLQVALGLEWRSGGALRFLTLWPPVVPLALALAAVGFAGKGQRGAAEAGGRVIGVTCEDIEQWRPIGANAWVKEEWRKKTLMDRLQGLIEGCDAALALPGGPGTLTEIALTWNLMIIGSLPRRPLILIGSGWQNVLDQVYQSFDEYISATQKELVQFAPDIQTAVKLLDSK